jgi:hypothetical protein
MATSYSPFEPGNDRHVLACFRGPDLIGHIIKRELRHDAYSWPQNMQIGSYRSCTEAAAALDASYIGDEVEGEMSRAVTTRPCPARCDYSCLFDRLLEMIAYRRIGETIALLRFLRVRGITGDDCLLSIEAALRRYDAE